jgi:hypothetical protein
MPRRNCDELRRKCDVRRTRWKVSTPSDSGQLADLTERENCPNGGWFLHKEKLQPAKKTVAAK